MSPQAKFNGRQDPLHSATKSLTRLTQSTQVRPRSPASFHPAKIQPSRRPLGSVGGCFVLCTCAGFACLRVCAFVSASACAWVIVLAVVFVFACFLVCLFVCLLGCLLVCLLACLLVCLFVCLLVHLYIHIYIYVCVYMYFVWLDVSAFMCVVSSRVNISRLQPPRAA